MGALKNKNKTLIFMISATLLGKILGLARDILLANFFGTSIEASSFIIASRLPLTFFDIALGAAVSSAFIPTFNSLLKNHSKDKAFGFANEFINLVFFLSLIITISLSIFTSYIVNAVAGPMDSKAYDLTLELTKILLPIIMLAAITFSFTGILQSLEEFIIPAMISVVSNTIIILYLSLFRAESDIYEVSYVMVIGWSMQLLIQLPFLFKYGFKVRPVFRYRSIPELKQVGLIMIPILISTWVQPINVWINTRLATGISSNSNSEVVILDYAYKLFIIVAGVIILGISNLVFPSMSKLATELPRTRYYTLLKSTLHMVTYYMIPITVGTIVLSYPIIKLLYLGGEFKEMDVYHVSSALKYYAVSIVFFGYREIYNKAYYSLGNSKFPLYFSIVGIVSNIILSLILVEYFGVNGLALAVSISTLLTAILLIIKFNYSEKNIIAFSDIFYFIKVLMNSIVMGFSVSFTYQKAALIFNPNKIGTLMAILVSSFIGMCVYFLLSFFTRLKIPSLKI